MSDLVANEINQLIIDIPKLKDYGQDYLFSALCLKYFLLDGHLSFRDFKSTFVDGKNDGGIDLITIDDSGEKPRLVFIQGKYITGLGNTQDLVDVFTKMDQTITDFRNNKFSGYNNRLKRIYSENSDLVKDQNPDLPQLILFIDVEIDESKREWVKNRLKSISDSYEFTIIDHSQIREQIELINNPLSHVNEDKIQWSKEDGKLAYGDDGLLVNVYANSIRNLYLKYKDKGLFAQNFRYYIRNKKIDDSVNGTLQKRRNDFWFLNNGIIIGCSDFQFDGTNIKLFNFSIINGCQTTSLIGDYSGSNEGEDFKIHCKIVKSSQHGQNFVAEIAEASNSQKPILDRDLKANYPEQIKLRRALEGNIPPVFLEVKRGQPRPNKKGKEDWQFIKNDVLGQLILSFLYQQPGTARSNKQKIFADIETYNKIFRRNPDTGMLVDLLKLTSYYKQYCEKRLIEGTAIDEDVLNNSEKAVIALIGFILKIKRELVDYRRFRNPEDWAVELSKDDLSGSFLDETSEKFDRTLDGLFTMLNKIIFDAYKKFESESKGVSKFLKLDSKYRDMILVDFIQSKYLNDYEFEIFNKNYLSILK